LGDIDCGWVPEFWWGRERFTSPYSLVHMGDIFHYLRRITLAVKHIIQGLGFKIIHLLHINIAGVMVMPFDILCDNKLIRSNRQSVQDVF
jgi:hypothetical protein